VKKLVAPGVTLILSQPVRLKTSKHDPWPYHAVDFLDWGYDVCASGRWIVFSYFTLKSGFAFIYPTQFFPDYATTQTFLNLWTIYTTADGFTGFFGEGFNFVYRPLAFDKKKTISRLRSKSDGRFGSDSSDAAKPLAGSFQRIPRLRFGCVCVRFVG
jgi:hypothetical protein